MEGIVIAETKERKDVYPSRRGDQPWSVIARRDPVVYGELDQGPLTREQLTYFEDNGFLFFEGMFSHSEMQEFLDEADNLRRHQPIGDERVVPEPDSQEIRSIFDIHRFSEVYGRLCANPMLSDVARQLLGSEVSIHQSRINYKSGFQGKEFYWHSDFETWHVEDGMPQMRAVSCVILLSENNEHNGPLMIIPGSHKLYISCEGETPPDNYKRSLKNQVVGVPPTESLSMMVEKWGIHSMKGAAGSVVFFDCNAMHGSTANMTPYPRNNLFFVYNSVENGLVQPYCGHEPRPNFIANRKIEPLS